MTLHIFKTEAQFKANQSLIAPSLFKEDAVLFIESAVYACCQNIDLNALLYVLSEDIKARGLDNNILSSFEIVSYDGFVVLTEAHEKIISW
jgi:tRNA 2-thiouridine synthesizing protein B